MTASTGATSAGVADCLTDTSRWPVNGIVQILARVANAETCAIECIKPGVHTNDFATIHGRPARIHTAPAESTIDSTYCLPQALCEYARGDRESWRNR